MSKISRAIYFAIVLLNLSELISPARKDSPFFITVTAGSPCCYQYQIQFRFYLPVYWLAFLYTTNAFRELEGRCNIGRVGKTAFTSMLFLS